MYQSLLFEQTTTIRPVKSIAITAGKGGVGKTNVAVNLGIALAQQGQSVLLFDADLSLANVDVLLGLHAQYNLSHVLAGQCRLEEIILEGPAGLKIVPAASGTGVVRSLSPTESAGLIHAFSELPWPVDVLLIDTAAGLSDSMVRFTCAANEILVVVCDEPTSITNAYALIKLFSREHGIERYSVVANMVRTPEEGQQLFAKLARVTEHFLDVALTYLGEIPYEESIHKAIVKQKAFIDVYPDCNGANAMRGLAQVVAQMPIAKHINGQVSFFLERLLNTPTAIENGLF